MKKEQNFSVVNFTREEVPIVTEDIKTRYGWVPVGVQDQDDFFSLLTEGYNTSTTTAACVDGVADLIYGKGLITDEDEFKDTLGKLIPAEDLKKVSFDLKLYGNAAFQILWNNEHTKVIKMFHVPVQTLRAEKIHLGTRCEAYYYCTY